VRNASLRLESPFSFHPSGCPMKGNHFWCALSSIGSRSFLSGLMICVSGSLSQIRADDAPAAPASAPHTGWSQGLLLAEIAWLANPATFHEQLSAVQSGDCLEIHGTASNEATRNLAMKLAREASRMTTVDRLQIAAAPAPPAPGRSLNMIYRDSVQALYHNCPRLSRSLTVTTQDRGEVLVRGEVPTLEDKLAVSRALKAVAGCNCVKNQVRAKSVGVDVLNASSKPKLQDNSLLVRLGIMQPRTEVAPSAPMVAQNTAPHAVAHPETVQPRDGLLLSMEPAKSLSPAQPAKLPDVVQVAAAPARVPSLPPLPCASTGPMILTSASYGVDTWMLQRSIALTCGIDPSRVHVVCGEGKMLTVTISVANLETGKQLAPKVLAMPELVPYGVSLDITLAK
jgi:hypothetical protein